MKTFSSLLAVTRKGARGACRYGYGASLCPYVYRLRVIVLFGMTALHLLANWKPCDPNLLDKFLKAFIVIATDLPRQWVKRSMGLERKGKS